MKFLLIEIKCIYIREVIYKLFLCSARVTAVRMQQSWKIMQSLLNIIYGLRFNFQNICFTRKTLCKIYGCLFIALFYSNDIIIMRYYLYIRKLVFAYFTNNLFYHIKTTICILTVSTIFNPYLMVDFYDSRTIKSASII